MNFFGCFFPLSDDWKFQTDTLPIAERFGANSAHRVDFAIPAIPPTPIQFVRLEALKAAPDARLVEIEVEALGDNLISGLRERGGNVEIIIGTNRTDFEAATLTNALRLIDGRINTYWRSGRVPRADDDVWAWIMLDLGAVYWIDQVHHIGHIDRGRHFNMNFHEMMTFDLFLEDSRLGPDVRQRVEPGDANPQVESSTNIVELPLDRVLFAHLSVYPRVLTPNGDGIGDRLFISLNLINVLAHRPLKLELFDLAGRRVRQLSAQALAGAQELVWDGRDQSGDLVPPGHYFLRLKVESDAHSQSVNRMVSIVY